MADIPTASKVISELRRAKPRLKARFPLRALSLFGSVARGDATPGSDIDILVDVDPSIGLEIVTLGDEIEQLLGHKVDLVSTRAIRAKMMQQINREKIDV